MDYLNLITKNSNIVKCPISGLKFKLDPKWINLKITDDYSISIYLIGSQIVLSVPKGRPTPETLLDFLKKRKEFLIEKKMYNKKFIELKDYRYVKKMPSRKLRTILTNFLIEERDRGFLQGFLIFNSPPYIKLAFNIGARLYKKTLAVESHKNYKKAINRALELLNNNKLSKSNISKPENNNNHQKRDKLYTQKEIDEYLQNYLKYIGTINWRQVEDLDNKKLNNITKDNPLKPLYESISLLKDDFNEILNENEITNERVKKAYNEVEDRVKVRTKELTIAHSMLKKLYSDLETKNNLIIKREEKLSEQKNILETSLDILSHDTKNLFLNLQVILQQEEDNISFKLAKETLNELYELIMEAAGYMKAKTRIYSVVDIINNMKISKKRLYLPSHKRISFTHSNYDELFIETSPLIKNAITNLVENALKYSPENKNIDVTVNRIDDSICINVADHGKGIPDKEKGKIMRKHYRMKETTDIEGSGRGLWITQSIINKENGKLEVKDNENGGAVFSITIPAFKIKNIKNGLNNLSEWYSIPITEIEKTAETMRGIILIENKNKKINDIDTFTFIKLLLHLRNESKDKNQEEIKKKLTNLIGKNQDGKSVLIVDDSVYVHYYLGTYFNNLGFNILAFGKNGKEGVELYEKYKPDLITLDKTMPIMNGFEAAKNINTINKNAKIIFITAVGDAPHITEELKTAVPPSNYKILTKPIKQDELKKALKEFF